MITPTMKLFMFLSFIHVVTSALAIPARQVRDAEQNTCDHPDCFTYANKLVAGIDWSTNPCEDFFQFACGRWIKKADNPNLLLSMDDISLQTAQLSSRIKEMLLFDAPFPRDEVALNKARQMYVSCVNAEGNVKVNIDQLKEFIKEFGGWKLGTDENVEVADAVSLITKIISSTDIAIPFNIKIGTTPRNASHYPVILPPEKFLKDLYPFLSAKEIVTIASTVFGVDDSEEALREAQDVLQFDNDLKILMNKIGKELLVYTKNGMVPWLDLMNEIFKGIKNFSSSDVLGLYSDTYVVDLYNKIKDKKGARTVYNYLILYETIQLLQLIEEFLPSPLREISAFGDLTQTSRLDACLPPVISCFDLAIARKYGEIYHKIQEEVEMLKELTNDILDEFSTRLGELDWLDEPSRSKAEEKLKFFKTYFEFPDVVMDLNKLNNYYEKIVPVGNFIGYSAQCTAFLRQLDLSTIIEPARGHIKWHWSPLLVNAYYNPRKNDIHILEAILGEPVFNIHRLRLMNYAGLGYILGHEVTHGFDNIGVNFDKTGNQILWLTPESQTKFNERTQCLVDQYSNYKLTHKDLPGPTTEYQLDGEETIRENIADDGGLKLSYFSYQKWLEDNKPEILPDILKRNFTAEQAFFLSFSRTWCVKYEKGITAANLKDSHSPDKFRINGPLSNFDKFGEAFKCPSGSPMVRGEKACHVW